MTYCKDCIKPIKLKNDWRNVRCKDCTKISRAWNGLANQVRKRARAKLLANGDLKVV